MMKQYWTPLARALGLYARPGAPETAAPRPAAHPAAPQPGTHWPELFEAFRRHALEQWLPACQRHAEVNAKEKLALQALTVTPCDVGIAAQLAQWKQQGSPQDLIRWLVNGPWNVPELCRAMDFSEFETLTLDDPEVPISQEHAAGYDWRISTKKSVKSLAPWRITEQTRWCVPVENAQPDVPAVDVPLAWLALLTDAASVRRLPPLSGLIILGQEKTVRMPDGQYQVLQDRLPLRWEQQTAVYVAVQGAFVSGLHLALRVGPHGVECQDLGSTNGSCLGDQRLSPGQWTALPLRTPIFLGGTASDLRAQAPSLEITGQTGVQAVSLEATPLRQHNPPDLLLIQPDRASDPVAVRHLPFLIGRAAECDWVVGAQAMMVSRKHLCIEQIDLAGGRILLRDLSRQGLTQCEGHWLEAQQQGVWVSVGSELVLGKSTDHEGLAFHLRWPDTAA